jgi:hypothetical protein
MMLVASRTPCERTERAGYLTNLGSSADLPDDSQFWEDGPWTTGWPGYLPVVGAALNPDRALG